jgi:hypothetical protein
VIFGLAASGLWSGGPSQIAKGVVVSRIVPAWIALPILAIGLATCGCGDPAFTRYSVAEAGNSLNQAIIGMEECRTALARDRDREADLQWKAYVADQGDTFALAVAQARTPAEVKAALDALALKFRGERLAAIETARTRTDERFVRVQRHFNYVAQILAKLDSLARKEESVQAQLAQYEAMAENFARQKFGLPPAPGTTGEPPPATTAKPVGEQPVAPSAAAAPVAK